MKSFLSGRPAGANPSLRPAGGPGDVPLVGVKPIDHRGALGPATGAEHVHGPTVECIKQGDKVVRMVITCTCGERIEVECLYPAAG